MSTLILLKTLNMKTILVNDYGLVSIEAIIEILFTILHCIYYSYLPFSGHKRVVYQSACKESMNY